MCTVTYIPHHEKVFLASNRDEKHWRSAAIPPREYEFPSGKIYFPRDGDAGGSWIAVHENRNVIVLLNGGWEKHIPDPPYEKSRGVVLLDLIQTPRPFDHFRSYNLENIEPFTLVMRGTGQLAECRWDGERKHAKKLDASLPHIWSSVTLYSKQVVAKREAWFEEWLKSQTGITLDDVLHFHQFTGDGDQHNDLLMNRDGQVYTVSITGMEITPDHAEIKYIDLQTQQTAVQQVSFTPERIRHL